MERHLKRFVKPGTIFRYILHFEERRKSDPRKMIFEYLIWKFYFSLFLNDVLKKHMLKYHFFNVWIINLMCQENTLGTFRCGSYIYIVY